MRFRDYITIDKLDVVGDLLVMGSFSVLGSASVINTTNLSVSDPIILLAASQSGSPTLDSGFFINRGTGATQGFIWDESTDEFALISTSASSTAIGNIDINSYSNLRLNGLTASQVRINTVSGSDPLIVRNASNTANQLEIQSDGKYRLGDENGGLNNAFSYISDGRLFMVKSGSNFIELNNSGANRLYNISSGWLLDGNTTISTYAVSGSTGSGSFYYFAGTFQIGDLVATDGASNAIWISNGTIPTTTYVNRHWYYSADVSAGNAAPHFRTENGSVIKLYNYGTVSTVQGIADALTGMGILGTSSVSVLSATPSLSDVLLVGNTTNGTDIVTSNDDVIIAATGGGVLNLRFGSNGSVVVGVPAETYGGKGGSGNGGGVLYLDPSAITLGLNGGDYSKPYVYLTTSYSQLADYSTHSSVYYGFNLYRNSSFNNYSNGVSIKENVTFNFTSVNENNYAIIIGSKNSTINAGVYNSVAIGGQGLSVTQSNTVVLGNTVSINNAYILPNTDGTNGQVMTTNGTGTVTWSTISGGITGSGTVGKLPKFTGTYSIGNSGFTDDGDIGAYSSGATLSVAFTSTQALFRDGSITSPAISFQNDTDTGFYRNVNNQITVMSGGNTSSIFTDKGINLDSEITNNTVYGIATASNDSDAVRYSQLLLTESYLAKSGYVEGASFSGSPLSYTVTFNTQFPDDNTYSISIIGEDSRAWSVSSVTKTQFTIESNSSTSLTGRVRWMAQKYNNV